MRIETIHLRALFTRIHEHALQNGAAAFLCGDYGERFRIALREPLGMVDLDGAIEPETITVVELVIQRRGDTLLIGPADEASRIVAAQWAERHRDTTREQFDWVPFVTEAA